MSVFLVAACCFVLLSSTSNKSQVDPQEQKEVLVYLDGLGLDIHSVCLLFGIQLFGSLAEVLESGFTVAIEKDWIVVMSELADENSRGVGEDKGDTWLTETNVGMKQIDLSCKVIAPAVGGLFVATIGGKQESGENLRAAAILVGALNMIALVVEYNCVSRVYHMIPELQVKKEGQTTTAKEVEISSSRGLIDEIILYMKQPMAWGGVALALIYVNMLTFTAIMIAYLVWRGMSIPTIGIWRGIAAALGLMATVVYRYSVARFSLPFTGLWSICFQFICLSVCYASLFVEEDYNLLSLSMLIGGVCASRVGLWVFDISIQQMMQETVPDDIRDIVGGVQSSLNAFFSLVGFAIGVVFPDPEDFHAIILAGYLSVTGGMVLYGIDVLCRRDKIYATTVQLH